MIKQPFPTMEQNDPLQLNKLHLEIHVRKARAIASTIGIKNLLTFVWFTQFVSVNWNKLEKVSSPREMEKNRAK